MRILVVEDDQTLGSLLSEYLKMLQHETIDVVSTGSEAREVIVAGEAYDCAFVDLMLPDIHGLELLQILKEYQPTTPSVIMSGHPTSEYALQAMRGGASDFLTKPFSLQELALTVERLGKERRLRLENRTLRVEQQGWAGRFSGIIKSLVNTLEERDPHTGKHSERVVGYAVGMAKALGCTGTQIDSLRTAGHLYDLGKIGIAESILNKPGALSPDEYEMIKLHPEMGDSIGAELGLSDEQRAIIRYHHERWDGRGYPSGLAQQEVPVLARIVAVADAFDSMTSKRADRGAMEEEVAIQELLDNAGTQFDPEVVKVFVAMRSDRRGDQEHVDGKTVRRQIECFRCQ